MTSSTLSFAAAECVRSGSVQWLIAVMAPSILTHKVSPKSTAEREYKILLR
jgi:hypothetical protein